MAPKRLLERDSTPTAKHRANKRRHVSSSLPTTPAASHISFPTPLKTPHTPYPPRPSDSPSNPFGKKRTRQLMRSLPPPTSFSKHLPLRFQFTRRGSSTPRQGGVYRVVQVPCSYTFSHLKCLIAFLFNGLHSPRYADDHIFEIKKDIALYSPLYKPGQVRSGHTWAKLSSSRNPYRYRSDFSTADKDDQEDDDDQLSSGSEFRSREQSEEPEDCNWQDEEEFTIGHAWPSGPDPARAIVYHHSRTTHVHITLNLSDIPSRKGKSNVPYVFSARGRVWLSLPPLPRPVFSVSAKQLSSPNVTQRSISFFTASNNAGDLADEDAEGESGEEDTAAADNNDWSEDPNQELDPQHWNDPLDAFLKFFSKYVGSKYPSPSLSDSDDAPEGRDGNLSEGDSLWRMSTPSLTRSSSTIPSSPLPSSPLSHSSGILARSSPPQHTYITLELPLLTPFPPRARQIRKRMERIEKRMVKLKNDPWLCAKDELPDDEEENDQLINDDGATSNPPKLKQAEPVPAGEPEPHDWDPFGDEIEL